MVSAATLFPNLSFVHNWPQVDEPRHRRCRSSRSASGSRSARRDRGVSWFAVDAAAPEEFKHDSYKAYLMCFGSPGMFEQDDVENWVSLTNTAGGSMARRLLPQQPDGPARTTGRSSRRRRAFAGPGRRVQGYSEYNQRDLLSQWATTRTRAGARESRRPGRGPMTQAGRCRTATRRTWPRTSSWSRRRTCSTPQTTGLARHADRRHPLPHAGPRHHRPRRRPRHARPAWPTSTRTCTRCASGSQRLATEHAWTEDPPSRPRHFVTNVRTFAHRRRDAPARRVGRAAVPQPRRHPRGRPDLRGPRRPAARETAAASSWPAARSPSTRRCSARRTWRCSCDRRQGDRPAIRLGNEFTEVVVEPVQTRNGVRLRISVPASGHQIILCPLELEALTWQDHEFFTRAASPPRTARRNPDGLAGRQARAGRRARAPASAGRCSTPSRRKAQGRRAGTRQPISTNGWPSSSPDCVVSPRRRDQAGRRARGRQRPPTPSAAWTSWSTASGIFDFYRGLADIRRGPARRRLRRDVRRQREEPAGHGPGRAARAAPGRRLGRADRVHVGFYPGPRRHPVRGVQVRRPRLRDRAGPRAGPRRPGQRRRARRHAGHRAAPGRAAWASTDQSWRRRPAARRTCAAAPRCRSPSAARTTRAATCSWPRTGPAGSPAPSPLRRRRRHQIGTVDKAASIRPCPLDGWDK